MRVKIKRNAVVCGGSISADQFRKMLKKVGGRWVRIETEFIFRNQYNTAPIPNVSISGLRVMWSHIDKFDYEGDKVLEVVCTAMQEGRVNCHSYRHDVRQFVGLHGTLPQDVRTVLGID